MDHKYKCCNKSFIHYVCTRCHEVTHKYCASKYKKTIRFISENKIICCGNDHDSDNDSINENLEKTIRELEEDRDVRDRHIQKIKKEAELLIGEATVREEELNAALKNQEAKIQELESYVRDLKQSISIYTTKVTKTSSTQTTFIGKDASTLTTAVQGLDYPGCSLKVSDEGARPVREIPAPVTKSPGGLVYKRPSRGRILILSDDYGQGVASLLLRNPDLQDYSVESVYKPGATYKQVIEDIEALSRGYSNGDHVIVIGGSNNFTKTTRYPLFKDISDGIKKCLNSNVTLVTVPCRKNSSANRFIHKFNHKLCSFVNKLNGYIPHCIKVIDVNDNDSGVMKRHSLCKQIVHKIKSPRDSQNCLLFIETDNSVVHRSSLQYDAASEEPSVSARSGNFAFLSPGTDLNNSAQEFSASVADKRKTPAGESSENFLYPRLSQWDLQI